MNGMRIINPNKGSVVVDQNYSNLCLRYTEAFQITGSATRYSTIRKWFTTTIGVVAFSVGSVLVGDIQRTADSAGYNITAETGTWVRAYIFDVSDYGERFYENGVGIRIRNPGTGRVMFDSRNKYLRLIDAIQGSGNSGHSVSRSYPGRQIAAIQNNAFATWFVAGPGDVGPFLATSVWAAMNATDSNFNTYQAQTQTQAPPPGPGPRSAVQPDWGYMIVDVTDF